MINSKLILLMLLVLSGSVIQRVEAVAGETAEENELPKKEKKEGPDFKPRPDSAISVILQLSEVQKWKKWIESKHDGSYMDVWGESVKEVEGSRCWGVAVAEKNHDEARVIARFCVMQTGLEIWVENVSRDIPEVITYFTYEKWRHQCKPDESSAGSC